MPIDPQDNYKALALDFLMYEYIPDVPQHGAIPITSTPTGFSVPYDPELPRRLAHNELPGITLQKPMEHLRDQKRLSARSSPGFMYRRETIIPPHIIVDGPADPKHPVVSGGGAFAYLAVDEQAGIAVNKASRELLDRTFERRPTPAGPGVRMILGEPWQDLVEGKLKRLQEEEQFYEARIH